LWELFFAVVLAAVILFTMLVEHGEPLADRLTVTGILLAMAGWYVGFGRSIVAAEEATWRGYVFQALILALFAAAMVLVDSVSFVLFALCPLAYMTVPMRWAHAAVAVLAFTPAMTHLATGDAASLRVLLPMGTVILVVSTVIAITIARTERQSAERAALIEELESTRAEVARLSREAGMAEERQRLAGDIHDTVAQGLSSVVMLVQAAQGALGTDTDVAQRHLAMAARTARENLDEARAIVGALMPTSLADTSLLEALQRLSDRFRGDAGIDVTVTVAGHSEPLPTSAEVVLLRVAQEALNNVRKHSGAARASLRLVFAPDVVLLEVRDQGSGFDPGTLAPGYGLGAMRTRVEQVGGRLIIRSAPGAGTTVKAEIDR
jgi:signal transduction histidine kinase